MVPSPKTGRRGGHGDHGPRRNLGDCLGKSHAGCVASRVHSLTPNLGRPLKDKAQGKTTVFSWETLIKSKSCSLNAAVTFQDDTHLF